MSVKTYVTSNEEVRFKIVDEFGNPIENGTP